MLLALVCGYSFYCCILSDICYINSVSNLFLFCHVFTILILCTMLSVFSLHILFNGLYKVIKFWLSMIHQKIIYIFCCYPLQFFSSQSNSLLFVLTQFHQYFSKDTALQGFLLVFLFLLLVISSVCVMPRYFHPFFPLLALQSVHCFPW